MYLIRGDFRLSVESKLLCSDNGLCNTLKPITENDVFQPMRNEIKIETCLTPVSRAFLVAVTFWRRVLIGKF